jgi:hypothetical protein
MLLVLKEKLLIIFLGITITLSFVSYIFKIGYLFGFTFNSFSLLHFININRWILLVLGPLEMSMVFVVFNYFIIKSYSSRPDLKDRKNILILDREKLKEKRFLSW